MSVGALAVSAAVILVVGLVVGLAAGYKIEQQRVKNDNKKAESTSKGSGNGANGSTSPTNVRLIGKVGVTDPNSVTLTVEGAKTMRFLTTPTTIFVKASPGTASDITQGSRVVWKAKAGSLAEAEEVVVLPADAKLGSAVVSATPTSMTIKNNGKEVTVSTQGATVLKVTTAKRDDI